MVYSRNKFDAETAKAWVGEGGMKQYFKVIPKPKPPKPRGRPPKRKARSTNKPPTEFNSVVVVVVIDSIIGSCGNAECLGDSRQNSTPDKHFLK